MTNAASRLRRAHFLGLTILAVVLSACGGGGGDSSGPPNNPPPPPPPPPQTISGLVMLGPVANADIEIVGTSGVLATGMTATDGTFGPIEFAGDYAGPLRIRAIGNASSTWVCDAYYGCTAGTTVANFGETLAFDGTLEAVLPEAADGQSVSVSLLSHLVSKRVDVLGPLSSANVTAAHADIANLLRTVMNETLTALAVELPDLFSTIPLFDLMNLPDPGSENDALSLVLTQFNASMQGLYSAGQTTGEFIDVLSAQIAANPDLPIAAMQYWEPSVESLATLMLIQLYETGYANTPPTEQLNALLAPATADILFEGSLNDYLAIPRLIAQGQDIYLFLDDSTIDSPYSWSVPVVTSDGEPLSTGDITVRMTAQQPGSEIWLDAQPVMIGDDVHVNIELNNSVVKNLSNGTHLLVIEFLSTTGEYGLDFMFAQTTVWLTRPEAYAGADVTAQEGSVVHLQGSTSTDPAEVASVNWTQLDGPGVVIENADTLTPAVLLPTVDAASSVTLELEVSFASGQSDTDTITITIEPAPRIADITFADEVLQQCVTDAALAGGYVTVDELLALACPGITNASGIGAFFNLATLDLSDNALTSIAPLLDLRNLEFVDLRGNPELPCSEVDELATRLEEGVSLLVDDSCHGSFEVELGAYGFDAALDTAREQIYVSVPDRKEVAVISTTELRIVDRLSLPGTPFGIDLSIDGTRLFVALMGSNAVAVIDLETRDVDTIDLGVSVDHPSTYDVVEGAPNRLFVTANPYSGGLARVGQVLLDQGNLTSSVGGNNYIRAYPVIARSPDYQFLYVGEGFSPNSLYKLDLLSPDAPIILEDDHGSVYGTDHLTVSRNGTRIHLTSGQILRTASFIEHGQVAAGVSVASSLTNTLFVAQVGGVISQFDFATLEELDTVETQCSGTAPTSRLIAYDGETSFFQLREAVGCFDATVSRSTPPDPYADFRFPDLAFEECVINAVTAMGYTSLGEITNLDCSTATRTILSLEGVERLTSLETLDISSSGVIDLAPLSALGELQSLVARDSAISGVSPLFDIDTLSHVDVTGNLAIACEELDELATGGVFVETDRCSEAVRLEFPGLVHDMYYAGSGNRLYVSVPSLRRIAAVNLDSGTVVENFTLPSEPRGIHLSADGQTLYAALYGDGDIAAVDVGTGNVDLIDISVELDDDRTWDVAEISPGRILATTNPGSNGFGYVVEVRRDLGDQATRVADQQIIRAAPVLAVDAQGTAVYVGEGFSPNSLYKLDPAQPDLPIVLEDDHGEISGTSHMSINSAGTRIYLASGQVVSTSTLQPVAQYPAGISAVADGNRLYIGDTEADLIRIYDTTTTGQVGTQQFGCSIENLVTLQATSNGVLSLGDELLCYTRTVDY